MDVPIGYVCIDRDNVIQRCERCIKEIIDIQKQKDNEMIDLQLQKHKKWSFLPWWKPWSRENVIAMLESDNWFSFPYRSLSESENLLTAARATKNDTIWIAAGACILYERFGKQK